MDERRIVLVENDKGLRAVLRGALTQAGWKVVGEASDGRRGVELTLDERPQVVLMDLQTSRMSAIEATRAIRAMAPDVEVVVLTSAEDRGVFDALKAGAGSYLMKGIAPKDMVAGVEDARAGESPISRTIAELVLSELQERAKTRSVPHGAGLTPLELDILRMLVEGETSPAVATRLGINIHTANAHVRAIYRKLEVTSRAQAVNKAVRDKIV